MSSDSVLPKPVFKACDETSLTLVVDGFTWDAQNESLFLEFKEPREDWSEAKEMLVTELTLKKETDIVDLKPGTPYFVRYRLERKGERLYGPHSVFDTMQIDCTPKKNKCTIM